MVASRSYLRWSALICVVCVLGLVGVFIGLAVRPYWPARTAPGAAEFDEGCQCLADCKLADAVAAFSQAIDKNPHHARAFFMRANAYKRQGSTPLAGADYAEALSLHKKIAEMDRAQRESAVPLGYDLAEAYINRATLLNLNRAGRPDEAIADFTEGLGLNPGNADAYYGRGMAFFEKGLFQLAIDDLTEAIRLAPDSAEAFHLRARVCLKAGKQEDAIEDARQAIQLDARRGDYFRTLGLAYLSAPYPASR